jgi:hypothetical protein
MSKGREGATSKYVVNDEYAGGGFVELVDSQGEVERISVQVVGNVIVSLRKQMLDIREGLERFRVHLNNVLCGCGNEGNDAWKKGGLL